MVLLHHTKNSVKLEALVMRGGGAREATHLHFTRLAVHASRSRLCMDFAPPPGLVFRARIVVEDSAWGGGSLKGEAAELRGFGLHCVSGAALRNIECKCGLQETVHFDRRIGRG